MELSRTRRTFLAAASSSFLLHARGELPGEAVKLIDPATEFEVIRVTAEKHNSWLPAGENRALTRKGDALIFASDRSGSVQLYRHDFKPNKLRPLTEASKLIVDSFTLDANDKHVLYMDNGRLMRAGSHGGGARSLLSLPDGASRFDVAGDTYFIAAGRKLSRGASEIATFDDAITSLSTRPGQPSGAVVAGGSLFSFSLNGSPRKLAADVLCARWSPTGEALFVLIKTSGLPELREVNPQSGESTLVAKTSQFGYFQRNGDASVFLGASSSLAQPNLVLLLRSAKRELTIAEHRASSAALTRAAFSPNSARLAFQTDRSGKSVVYAMAVEKLVEQTDEV